LAGTRARPRLWLIDEADAFVRADLRVTNPRRAPVLWALRSMAAEGTAFFVLAGFWDLFSAAAFDAQSPVRNLGELVRLGPLDRRSARQLVEDPMASLNVRIDSLAVDRILADSGCRANVIALVCQDLVTRLDAKYRCVGVDDVEAVLDRGQGLPPAVSYWKREGPLDRAVVHAALSLSDGSAGAPSMATRSAIDERLRGVGIRASQQELDDAFERLELGYVLARRRDPSGERDVWIVPVPLVARYEARIASWDEHLARDAEDHRNDVSRSPSVTT